MKATVEHEGTVVIIEDGGGNLTTLLEMIEQAILGCGFKFDGHLDFVEDDQ